MRSSLPIRALLVATAALLAVSVTACSGGGSEAEAQTRPAATSDSLAVSDPLEAPGASDAELCDDEVAGLDLRRG